MLIIVRYKAVDGPAQTRRFKTLDGARRFACRCVGPTPEIGMSYAVSGDGMGRVVVDTDGDEPIDIHDLFPALDPFRADDSNGG